MPEINPFNKNFLTKISDQKEKSNPREEIRNAIEDLDIPIIGKGSTCIVIENPLNKNKVVSISYKNLNVLQAKDIYYSSKIYNALFPHNFPKIHFASAEQNDEKLNGTIREKIEGKVVMPGSYREENLHPYSEIRNEIIKLAQEPYNLPVGMDGTIGNFMENDNGTYYVDTLSVGSIMKRREEDKTSEINIEAINNYMRDKKYSDSDINTVISSLRRLQALYADKKEK